ncbi:MAG: hypothetical protein AAB227_00555 [Pseudomonadota bacterium]
MKRLFAGLAAFALSVPPVLAADVLSADAARHFADTLAPVQSLGDAFEKEGKFNVLLGGGATVDGVFKPYSAGVIALKTQLPNELGRLAAVVKPHGFTPEEWGLAGDRVMAAYMALRIEREQPGALAQIDLVGPAEIEKMPPDLRKQMLEYNAMVTALKKAPDADKLAVMPAVDTIDAYIAAQEATDAPKTDAPKKQ